MLRSMCRLPGERSVASLSRMPPGLCPARHASRSFVPLRWNRCRPTRHVDRRGRAHAAFDRLPESRDADPASADYYPNG